MVSQTAEYALRAVAFLGVQGGAPQTTRSIAEVTRVPTGYLSKVLQSLSRAGIVRSQRGLHGGFVLARPASETTLLDVIRVVEPLRRITSCPLELPEHADSLCPLHQRLDDAVALIERCFGGTTIEELVSSGSVHGPLCRPRCNGQCRSATAQPGQEKGNRDGASTT